MAEHLDASVFEWTMRLRDEAVIACSAKAPEIVVGEGDVFGFPSQDRREPCAFADELLDFLVNKAMGIGMDDKK